MDTISMNSENSKSCEPQPHVLPINCLMIN